MDAQLNAVLAEINDRLNEEWEEHKAPVDEYLEGISSILSERFGVEAGDAREAVKEAVVEMVRFGALPELPGDAADEQKAWIEHAHTMGIMGAALRGFEVTEADDTGFATEYTSLLKRHYPGVKVRSGSPSTVTVQTPEGVLSFRKKMHGYVDAALWKDDTQRWGWHGNQPKKFLKKFSDWASQSEAVEEGWFQGKAEDEGELDEAVDKNTAVVNVGHHGLYKTSLDKLKRTEGMSKAQLAKGIADLSSAFSNAPKQYADPNYWAQFPTAALAVMWSSIYK